MDINEKLHMNAKALCKINGKKLGDIEDAICVTRGYLSRSKGISIQKVAQIAHILDVSIDDLLYGDYGNELERKEAVESLKEAVMNARRFFSGDKILNIIDPIIKEGWCAE